MYGNIQDYERPLKWDSPKFTIEETEKAIIIRGIAVPANTTSKNNKHYTATALAAGAHTFNGKPLTINHDGTKIAGNVQEMYYDEETDAMRYKAIVKNQPYVGLIRSKSATVKGVSIEATYLFNRCRDCGKNFYTAEEFKSHSYKEHFKSVSLDEPHGLKGQALSIVLSPEEAGVNGNTLEIAEKNANKDMFWLLETIIQSNMEKEKMSTTQTVKTNGQIGPPYTVKEQASVSKQEKKTYVDMESCVKDGNSKQECISMMKDEDPQTKTKKEKTSSSHDESDFAETQTHKIVEKLTIKEECGKFDFDACLASGKSEEECAAIAKEKRETKEYKQSSVTKINELIEAFNGLKFPVDDKTWIKEIAAIKELVANKTKEIAECIQALPADDVSWNEKITILQEMLITETKKLTEAIQNLPKDDLTWNTKIKDVTESLQNKMTGIGSELLSLANTVKTEISKLQETVSSVPKDEWKQPLKEAIDTIPKDEWKQPLTESIKTLQETFKTDITKLNDAVSTIPKGEWEKPLTETFEKTKTLVNETSNTVTAKLTEQENLFKQLSEKYTNMAGTFTQEIADTKGLIGKLQETVNSQQSENAKVKEMYEKNLAAFEKDIKEYYKPLEKRAEELEKTVKAQDEELKETKNKLQETTTLAENTSDKLKPEFKGKAKETVTKQQAPTSFNPYDPTRKP